MKKKNQKKNTTRVSDPLVAIDFGSQEIVAMAAAYDPEEPLHILGVEKTNRHNCVKNGIIVNTSDAGFNIKSLLQKLSNRIGYSVDLPSAFITIGGRTMQMARIPAKRNLGRRLSVSEAVLDSMLNECRDKIESTFHDKELVVLSIEPYEFILDGELQYHAPTKEQKVLMLEVHYVAFVGHKSILENTSSSFARSGVVVEDMWMRPLAHVKALATDQDQKYGCAILDLGDQTTTLSVYRDSHFVYSKVVPLGGQNITRDIQQQGISFDNAKKLKHLCGYAEERSVEKNQRISIPSENDPSIPVHMTTTFLAMIINSRLNEILTPLMNDLNERYANEIETLYITGGGARMRKIQEYIQTLTKIKVVCGSHADWLDEETPNEYYAPEYSALVGTLILADEYRQNGNSKTPGPIQPDNFWDKIKQKIETKVVTLFEDEQTTN